MIHELSSGIESRKRTFSVDGSRSNTVKSLIILILGLFQFSFIKFIPHAISSPFNSKGLIKSFNARFGACGGHNKARSGFGVMSCNSQKGCRLLRRDGHFSSFESNVDRTLQTRSKIDDNFVNIMK